MRSRDSGGDYLGFAERHGQGQIVKNRQTHTNTLRSVTVAVRYKVLLQRHLNVHLVGFRPQILHNAIRQHAVWGFNFPKAKADYRQTDSHKVNV